MGDYSRDNDRHLWLSTQTPAADAEQRQAEEDAAWAQHEAQRANQDGFAR